MKFTFKKPKLKKPNINSKKVFNFFIKIGSKSIAQFFLLFLVLIGINYFSQKYFWRIDLTETSLYSLSEGTKNIISNLEEDVIIKTYFSENIPPTVIQATNNAKDLFEEYERYSNGKVKFTQADPGVENFKENARNAGIPEVQFSELAQDKFEIKQGFIGASIEYKEKKEPIKVISNVQNLEYETSSRIYQLTQGEKPTIGFLTGHGEKDLFSELTQVNEILQRQFETQVIDLSEGSPINPEEIKVLIIPGVESKFSQRDFFELDQYIMKGGRMIVLADIYKFDMQNPILNKTESNINEFLKNFGAQIPDSIVLDKSYLPIISGFRSYEYPFWIQALNENFKTDNPALTDLETSVFFWTCPINKTELDEGQEFVKLITTTDKAWERKGEQITVDVQNSFTAIAQKQYTLMALLEGEQNSMFKDKDIPKLEDEKAQDKRTKENNRVDKSENIKLIVAGDADFITDQIISGVDGGDLGVQLFANTVDWMASSEKLIDIRSKEIKSRPLESLRDSTKNTVKILIVTITPIFVVLAGVFYNFIQKRKKSRI